MQRLAKLAQQLFPWTLVAIALLTMTGLPVAAQTPSTPRLLAVTGYGHAQATTTLAQITLGIAEKGNSAQDTFEKINQRTSAVSKLLKTNKVDRVKLSNIHLDPKYGRDGKLEKASYEGYQNIKFQLPVDKIGVLDQAIATGIDNLHSINYLASKDAITTARNQALEKALTDAQYQANVVLDELGLSLQEIVDIQIEDTRVDNPDTQFTQDTSYSSKRWPDPPPGDEGEQSVTVRVTLQIRY